MRLRSAECHYLPHHLVVKETKDPTKVRIVFGASATSERPVRLNDTFFLFFIIRFVFLSFSFRFLIKYHGILTNQKRELLVSNCQWNCMRIPVQESSFDLFIFLIFVYALQHF